MGLILKLVNERRIFHFILPESTTNENNPSEKTRKMIEWIRHLYRSRLKNPAQCFVGVRFPVLLR